MSDTIDLEEDFSQLSNYISDEITRLSAPITAAESALGEMRRALRDFAPDDTARQEIADLKKIGLYKPPDSTEAIAKMQTVISQNLLSPELTTAVATLSTALTKQQGTLNAGQRRVCDHVLTAVQQQSESLLAARHQQDEKNPQLQSLLQVSDKLQACRTALSQAGVAQRGPIEALDQAVAKHADKYQDTQSRTFVDKVKDVLRVVKHKIQDKLTRSSDRRASWAEKSAGKLRDRLQRIQQGAEAPKSDDPDPSSKPGPRFK